ncbi:hypothetical protein KJ586_03490 [Patescibacteria group bacterium]|nr:hypothetical protein [Patescibacteria group bacterium]
MVNFFLNKKFLFAIGFILTVLVLGYLIYSLFFKPAVQQPAETEPATSTTAGLPIAPYGAGQVAAPAETDAGLPQEGAGPAAGASAIARGGITQTSPLLPAASFSATLAPNGSDLQYYNKTDGKFYRVSKDGEATALSDKIFHQVESVKWSPDKNKAILEYPDGANIVYDFASGEQITLPAHWKDFDFSPGGRQIVMKSIGLDPNNRWLSVVNSDGSKAQRVEALGDKDDTVYPSWSPNGQTIAMYTEGIDFDRQEVFFVGLNNENFKSMEVEGRGFQPKWSPAGEQLLYSVYSSQTDLKPALWIANSQGENIGSGRKSLNIETWAEKCVFADSANLYCAVPEKLEEGAGLFPEMADNTRDNLYKIDVKTGLKKLVAVPDGEYNMSNLIISENGQYLYFTDKTTGNLRKIQLK